MKLKERRLTSNGRHNTIYTHTMIKVKLISDENDGNSSFSWNQVKDFILMQKRMSTCGLDIENKKKD